MLTITNLGPAAATEPIIFGAPLLTESGLLSVQAGAPGLCPVVIDHLDPPPGNPPYYFLTAYPGSIEPGQSRECTLVLGLPLQSNQPWSVQFLVTGGNDPNPANDGVTIELAPQAARPIPGWSTAASIASALALILAGGSRLRRYPWPEHRLRLG